jgi:hypothetical protein
MKVRSSRRALVLALIPLASLSGACKRKQVEVNDITPSVAFNRPRAPLGSAVEVTYTWTTGPGFKPLKTDYRALAHFLDTHKVVLFADDHVPVPAPTTWEPNKTYSYQRTVFIPVYPYVGPGQVVMGLYPTSGKGERVAMKGEDVGLRAYKVGTMELLPQTDNIFLVYKEGWHNPESAPHNPSLERTWTKKDALVSFKNPKKDIVIYVEADTNYKAFEAPPVLTLSVGNKVGAAVPIDSSEVFLKKVRVKGADLGSDEWVDLRLSMNQSFVPKLKGVNTHDDRELGVMVYHLYVGEADGLGTVPQVVDAGPVTAAAPMVAARGAAPAKAAPAKATPPASPSRGAAGKSAS